MNENKSEYIYELDTNDIIKINNDNAEENNNMSIYKIYRMHKIEKCRGYNKIMKGQKKIHYEVYMMIV